MTSPFASLTPEQRAYWQYRADINKRIAERLPDSPTLVFELGLRAAMEHPEWAQAYLELTHRAECSGDHEPGLACWHGAHDVERLVSYDAPIILPLELPGSGGGTN